MKWSMYVTPDECQFNLEPENETERELCKMLGKFGGQAHVAQGAQIGMTMGGYIRNFGPDSTVTAITLSKPKEAA